MAPARVGQSLRGGRIVPRVVFASRVRWARSGIDEAAILGALRSTKTKRPDESGEAAQAVSDTNTAAPSRVKHSAESEPRLECMSNASADEKKRRLSHDL
jgi:hypothetical protein